ncbi:Sugar transport protein MST8 [Paramyrothecium foliicola]|nr:Sugar transport protein MST8 [Paramyrothecium foliicola]
MAPKLVPNYVWASLAVSLGGFLNGFDTGCIGAITRMPQFTATVGEMSSFVLGITVSMIMLTGAFPSLFSGHLADKRGRLSVIKPGAILFGVGAILQGTSFSLAQFILGRAVSGFGQGVFLGNMAVYITEVAPMKRRGTLAAMPQFMATAGICIGYFACYGSIAIPGSMAWRAPYIVQVIVSYVLAHCCIELPESPRWLMLRGRAADAMTSLRVLEFDMEEARRDFLSTPVEQQNLTTLQSFQILFRQSYRSRTVLALFILGMVQFSGIDAVTYYAPALFAQAGISSNDSSFLASGVSMIAMLVATIPAVLLADKWGRRTSAISGGLGLCALMFLIGSMYASESVHAYGTGRWVVVISVYLFGIVYCLTWGIFAKIYASEIQPGHTRAAANSIGMALSFFTNWLVASITPILLSASAFGAYFLFGGLALFTVGFLAMRMPETKGRSLESIQEAFQHPATSNFLQLLQPLRLRRRNRREASPNNPVPESDAVELETRIRTGGSSTATAASSVGGSGNLGSRIEVFSV